MTFPGRSTFQVGGVVFPLTNTSGNDLVVDADPAIYAVLQFYKYCINTYIGARWLTQATKANILDAKDQLITSPVEQLVPYSPADYLLESQFRFPMLSADRLNEKYEKKFTDATRGWYAVSYTLEVMYMLPPLTAEQMYHLGGFRTLIPRILQDRTELGWDPNYQGGVPIFKNAGLDEIQMIDARYIGMENPKNVKTFFPAIIMNFEVKERKNYVNGSDPPFTGVDGTIDISDGYQPDNYDMIDFKIDL